MNKIDAIIVTNASTEEIAALVLAVQERRGQEIAMATKILAQTIDGERFFEPQDWTADVIARMHLSKITAKKLAEEAGYTPEYVSMVLNGHRDTKNAKATILAALDRLTCASN